MKGTNPKLGRMVRLALLSAIVVLLSLTPLGYLKAGPVEITFLMLPVVVGAVILGPGAGAFLGTLFGLSSFLTCYGIGVPSAFGAALVGINPFLSFVTCMVPRVLAGWLTGLIFQAMRRTKAPRTIAFGVPCLAGALMNTVFFTSSLMLCFGNTEFIMNIRGGQNLLLFMAGFVGINGLVEAAACMILGTAVAAALASFLPPEPARR